LKLTGSVAFADFRIFAINLRWFVSYDTASHPPRSRGSAIIKKPLPGRQRDRGRRPAGSAKEG
jgi:hypothetical protein